MPLLSETVWPSPMSFRWDVWVWSGPRPAPPTLGSRQGHCSLPPRLSRMSAWLPTLSPYPDGGAPNLCRGLALFICLIVRLLGNCLYSLAARGRLSLHTGNVEVYYSVNVYYVYLSTVSFECLFLLAYFIRIVYSGLSFVVLLRDSRRQVWFIKYTILLDIHRFHTKRQ